MLTVVDGGTAGSRRSTSDTQRLTRRELLRAGGLSCLGWSSGLGLWPAATSANANELNPADESRSIESARAIAKAKRCIVLFLMGGPPQHSTWDPKPLAPEEIRGALRPTATIVPGVHICELLPQTAQLTDHIAILRAVTTGDHAHSSSGYAMLTGRPHQPLNFENANPGAPNNWPTLGAVVQHLHRGEYILPPSVRLPHHIFNTDRSVWPGQDSGFLGADADPWLFRGEPASPEFQIPEFQLPDDTPLVRLNHRRKLLRQLDQQLASLDRSGEVEAFDQKKQQAFRLLTSSQTGNAFNLAQESDRVRDRYGRSQFGQSVLLGRRLLEAGVAHVQVNWFRGADEPDDAPCWDSHARETSRLKDVLLPPFDQAYSALLTDLIDRGMLDDTLVVCLGEFGRTPRMNPQGGRDHWGHVFSITLAGGGIRGGVVHGASDNHGAYPISGKVTPADLTATVFHCLGLRPETEIRDRLGRPFPISEGRVIGELL